MSAQRRPVSLERLGHSLAPIRKRAASALASKLEAGVWDVFDIVHKVDDIFAFFSSIDTIESASWLIILQRLSEHPKGRDWLASADTLRELERLAHQSPDYADQLARFVKQAVRSDESKPTMRISTPSTSHQSKPVAEHLEQAVTSPHRVSRSRQTQLLSGYDVVHAPDSPKRRASQQIFVTPSRSPTSLRSSSSSQGALALPPHRSSRRWSPGLGGWKFPFVRLRAEDAIILERLTHQLETGSFQQRVRMLSFLHQHVLEDFPPEAILQRPGLVYACLDELYSTAEPTAEANIATEMAVSCMTLLLLKLHAVLPDYRSTLLRSQHGVQAGRHDDALLESAEREIQAAIADTVGSTSPNQSKHGDRADSLNSSGDSSRQSRQRHTALTRYLDRLSARHALGGSLREAAQEESTAMFDRYPSDDSSQTSELSGGKYARYGGRSARRGLGLTGAVGSDGPSPSDTVGYLLNAMSASAIGAALREGYLAYPPSHATASAACALETRFHRTAAQYLAAIEDPADRLAELQYIRGRWEETMRLSAIQQEQMGRDTGRAPQQAATAVDDDFADAEDAGERGEGTTGVDGLPVEFSTLRSYLGQSLAVSEAAGCIFAASLRLCARPSGASLGVGLGRYALPLLFDNAEALAGVDGCVSQSSTAHQADVGRAKVYMQLFDTWAMAQGSRGSVDTSSEPVTIAMSAGDLMLGLVIDFCKLSRAKGMHWCHAGTAEQLNLEASDASGRISLTMPFHTRKWLGRAVLHSSMTLFPSTLQSAALELLAYVDAEAAADFVFGTHTVGMLREASALRSSASGLVEHARRHSGGPQSCWLQEQWCSQLNALLQGCSTTTWAAAVRLVMKKIASKDSERQEDGTALGLGESWWQSRSTDVVWVTYWVSWLAARTVLASLAQMPDGETSPIKSVALSTTQVACSTLHNLLAIGNATIGRVTLTAMVEAVSHMGPDRLATVDRAGDYALLWDQVLLRVALTCVGDERLDGEVPNHWPQLTGDTLSATSIHFLGIVKPYLQSSRALAGVLSALGVYQSSTALATRPSAQSQLETELWESLDQAGKAQVVAQGLFAGSAVQRARALADLRSMLGMATGSASQAASSTEAASTDISGVFDTITARPLHDGVDLQANPLVQLSSIGSEASVADVEQLVTLLEAPSRELFVKATAANQLADLLQVPRLIASATANGLSPRIADVAMRVMTSPEVDNFIQNQDSSTDSAASTPEMTQQLSLLVTGSLRLLYILATYNLCPKESISSLLRAFTSLLGRLTSGSDEILLSLIAAAAFQHELVFTKTVKASDERPVSRRDHGLLMAIPVSSETRRLASLDNVLMTASHTPAPGQDTHGLLPLRSVFVPHMLWQAYPLLHRLQIGAIGRIDSSSLTRGPSDGGVQPSGAAGTVASASPLYAASPCGLRLVVVRVATYDQRLHRPPFDVQRADALAQRIVNAAEQLLHTTPPVCVPASSDGSLADDATALSALLSDLSFSSLPESNELIRCLQLGDTSRVDTLSMPHVGIPAVGVEGVHVLGANGSLARRALQSIATSLLTSITEATSHAECMEAISSTSAAGAANPDVCAALAQADWPSILGRLLSVQPTSEADDAVVAGVLDLLRQWLPYMSVADATLVTINLRDQWLHLLDIRKDGPQAVAPDTHPLRADDIREQHNTHHSDMLLSSAASTAASPYELLVQIPGHTDPYNDADSQYTFWAPARRRLRHAILQLLSASLQGRMLRLCVPTAGASCMLRPDDQHTVDRDLVHDAARMLLLEADLLEVLIAHIECAHNDAEFRRTTLDVLHSAMQQSTALIAAGEGGGKADLGPVWGHEAPSSCAGNADKGGSSRVLGHRIVRAVIRCMNSGGSVARAAFQHHGIHRIGSQILVLVANTVLQHRMSGGATALSNDSRANEHVAMRIESVWLYEGSCGWLYRLIHARDVRLKAAGWTLARAWMTCEWGRRQLLLRSMRQQASFLQLAHATLIADEEAPVVRAATAHCLAAALQHHPAEPVRQSEPEEDTDDHKSSEGTSHPQPRSYHPFMELSSMGTVSAVLRCLQRDGELVARHQPSAYDVIHQPDLRPTCLDPYLIEGVLDLLTQALACSPLDTSRAMMRTGIWSSTPLWLNQSRWAKLLQQVGSSLSATVGVSSAPSQAVSATPTSPPNSRTRRQPTNSQSVSTTGLAAQTSAASATIQLHPPGTTSPPAGSPTSRGMLLAQVSVLRALSALLLAMSSAADECPVGDDADYQRDDTLQMSLTRQASAQLVQALCAILQTESCALERTSSSGEASDGSEGLSMDDAADETELSLKQSVCGLALKLLSIGVRTAALDALYDDVRGFSMLPPSIVDCMSGLKQALLASLRGGVQQESTVSTAVHGTIGLRCAGVELLGIVMSKPAWRSALQLDLRQLLQHPTDIHSLAYDGAGLTYDVASSASDAVHDLFEWIATTLGAVKSLTESLMTSLVLASQGQPATISTTASTPALASRSAYHRSKTQSLRAITVSLKGFGFAVPTSSTNSQRTTDGRDDQLLAHVLCCVASALTNVVQSIPCLALTLVPPSVFPWLCQTIHETLALWDAIADRCTAAAASARKARRSHQLRSGGAGAPRRPSSKGAPPFTTIKSRTRTPDEEAASSHGSRATDAEDGIRLLVDTLARDAVGSVFEALVGVLRATFECATDGSAREEAELLVQLGCAQELSEPGDAGQLLHLPSLLAAGINTLCTAAHVNPKPLTHAMYLLRVYACTSTQAAASLSDPSLLPSSTAAGESCPLPWSHTADQGAALSWTALTVGMVQAMLKASIRGRATPMSKRSVDKAAAHPHGRWQQPRLLRETRSVGAQGISSTGRATLLLPEGVSAWAATMRHSVLHSASGQDVAAGCTKTRAAHEHFRDLGRWIAEAATDTPTGLVSDDFVECIRASFGVLMAVACHQDSRALMLKKHLHYSACHCIETEVIAPSSASSEAVTAGDSSWSAYAAAVVAMNASMLLLALAVDVAAPPSDRLENQRRGHVNRLFDPVSGGATRSDLIVYSTFRRMAHAVFQAAPDRGSEPGSEVASESHSLTTAGLRQYIRTFVRRTVQVCASDSKAAPYFTRRALPADRSGGAGDEHPDAQTQSLLDTLLAACVSLDLPLVVRVEAAEATWVLVYGQSKILQTLRPHMTQLSLTLRQVEATLGMLRKAGHKSTGHGTVEGALYERWFAALWPLMNLRSHRPVAGE